MILYGIEQPLVILESVFELHASQILLLVLGVSKCSKHIVVVLDYQ